MKYVRSMALFIVTLFLFASTLPHIAAESEETNEDPYTSLIDKILLKIYTSTRLSLRGIVPWSKGMINIPPIPFEAEPSVVDLEYLTTSEIVIGAKNATTGDWMSREEYKTHPLFPAEDYTFELEAPDYIPEGIFIGYFDPQGYDMGSEGEQKTTLSIKTLMPEDIALPKEVLLWVNVTKWTTGANLYFPPNPIQQGRSGIIAWIQWLIWVPFWFAAGTGITGGFPFAKLYSGVRAVESYTRVPLLIKLNRYHLAEIEPTKTITIKPDDVASLPIMVKNYGSHIDTFNFEVSADPSYDLVISPPPAITLGPHETGYVSLSIASSQRFMDPGTARPIEIQAYSIYDNETVFCNTATIITRGIYVSEINAAYSAVILIVIALIAIILFYSRRRMFAKICQKPDKPWEIPKEKKHLEQLKEKDEEKYNKTMEMMKDEYKSSLLWYRYYCKSMLMKTSKKKKPITKEIIDTFTGVFKKLEKKPVEEKKPKDIKPKPEPKEPKEEEKIETPIEKITKTERRNKNKIISKIKKAQEKQRRKIKK
ncbi:MAG: hypothetical protein JSW62_01310 [Thermoplasmatales archaeon]|nr:MAG: hypothetical protein JSW62_01310 [Thermoplasmatales archaeon]